MSKMKCKICGSELYRGEGLSTESDGIRSDYWCEECKTMFTSTKACLVKRLVLRDAYEGDAKERLLRLASKLLGELRNENS